MPDNKPRMTAAEMTERAYHFFLDAKGLSPRAGQVDMMAFCSAVVNATPAEEQYRVGVIEAGTGGLPQTDPVRWSAYPHRERYRRGDYPG